MASTDSHCVCACAPLTGPSLSCMLTGKLPHEVGVAPGNRSLMPPGVFTLAEAISEKGIPTAAVVSNYVLRSQPGAGGAVGVEQGFVHFDDRMSERELNRPMYERRASDTATAAIEWIDSATQEGDNRFFLWVHFQDPHGPYTPAPEFARAHDRHPGGDKQLPIGRTHKSKGQLPSYQVLEGIRDPDHYLGRYDGEVATADSGIGLLLAALEERGLFDDALLIFSADHGESLGEHDYWFGHGEHLYRDVVRIPLLVRFPGGARAGATGALASHLDIFPTVLNALGIDPGPTLGTSLISSDPPEGRVAISSLHAIGAAGRLESFSDGRWRMLLGGGSPPRLYDLATDPAESASVARKSPGQMKRIQAAALQMASGAGPPIKGIDRRMEAGDRKAFDDMGYGGGDGGDDGH